MKRIVQRWLDALLHRGPGYDLAHDQTTEVERLRAENARMRHELEVMYDGAFNQLPAPNGLSAGQMRHLADRAARGVATPTEGQHLRAAVEQLIQTHDHAADRAPDNTTTEV